jgi:hypothetical protein
VIAQQSMSTDGFALKRTSDIVFAQQIAGLEMSDDLITKALQSHMLNRAPSGQNADQPALSGENFLELTGFDKPELTIVVADDGPDPAFLGALWGDIYPAKARDQHSCIVRLTGAFGDSFPKAVCYVEVTLPAFREQSMRPALAECSLLPMQEHDFPDRAHRETE